MNPIKFLLIILSLSLFASCKNKREEYLLKSRLAISNEVKIEVDNYISQETRIRKLNEKLKKERKALETEIKVLKRIIEITIPTFQLKAKVKSNPIIEPTDVLSAETKKELDHYLALQRRYLLTPLVLKHNRSKKELIKEVSYLRKIIDKNVSSSSKSRYRQQLNYQLWKFLISPNFKYEKKINLRFYAHHFDFNPYTIANIIRRAQSSAYWFQRKEKNGKKYLITQKDLARIIKNEFGFKLNEKKILFYDYHERFF